MTEFRNSALVCLALLVGFLTISLGAEPVRANGERVQEPFFRMRSFQWFDVTWSKTEIGVNEELQLNAKVYVMKDWPESIPQPELVFVSLVSAGPVVVRKASYLNDVPARQSFKDMELGKVYDYKMTLVGRIPGRWHIHPAIAVSGAGPIVGPGAWIEVTGSHSDFVFPIQTMTGVTIENLETYGLLNIGMWHLIWFLIGASWLLYWLLRPVLIPRMIALQAGREDLLIRRIDVIVGASLAIGSIILVAISFGMGVTAHPNRTALQITVNEAPEIDQPPMDVTLKLKRATYDVPGRAMRMSFEATNTGDTALTLGEFTTSSLRFIDMNVPQAVARLSPDYPMEWVPQGGLTVDNNAPLLPGETRTYNVEAIDVAWELERLTSFVTDVDARFGGLFFFYEGDGTRHLAEIAGPILPVFQTSAPVASRPADMEMAAVGQQE
jgi:methane/ammonia monooxygenase subunit B